MDFERFDRVAALTGTSRPVSKALPRTGVRPPQGEYVLKRKFSANKDHVHFVHGKPDFTWKEIDGQLPSPFTWIKQDFEPLLKQWGEWRLFMIDGKVRECVSTHLNDQGGWEFCAARFGYSLERLGYVHP